MQKILLSLFLCFGLSNAVRAQALPNLDSIRYLLSDVTIQIEITSGVDDMYNFKFFSAESQFNWLRKLYPRHPLPYFLLGLSNWWKIMPNIDNTKHDEKFLAYMDSTIMFAEVLFDKDKTNAEAAFFLSGAHGLKARLQGERKEWRLSALSGNRSLDYLNHSREQSDLSPEFLFGDGLYNYYSIWIRENYPMLKPLLWLFGKGDKKLGIEQLERVTKEAFYSKVEAQMYLMRIYSSEQGEGYPEKAFFLAEYLHNKYPDNPYFHRQYARALYQYGRPQLLEAECLRILERIKTGVDGYEATSGRYAAFFLGGILRMRPTEVANAMGYFDQAVAFSEQTKATDSGYYLYALQHLGKYWAEQKNIPLAAKYYAKILKYADSDHNSYVAAKKFEKDNKENKKLIKAELKKLD